VGEVARRLFLELGYPATTMAQIADESGVPSATIYRLFGSKRGILKAVLDIAFGGDDEVIEFQRRPAVRAAFAHEDPGAMLDAFAGVLRELMHRAGALQHVIATSAAVDSEAAEMLTSARSQRLRGQGRIVRDLARRKALRPGLTQNAAADIVYTVMSPEVYRILTVERGWSDDDYEAWLARTLRTQLLATHAKR
jgi:TetR/AcrR family transcriptional regulator, regulator of autoinduction and epiphytic fitness